MATPQVQRSSANGTEKQQEIETAPDVGSSDSKQDKNARKSTNETGKKGKSNKKSKKSSKTQDNDKESSDSDNGKSIGCAGNMRKLFKKKKQKGSKSTKDKRPIDKPQDFTVQFVEDDYPQKERLANIAKNNLVGVGLVDHAAVCTFDGRIAASCPLEFQPTVEEITTVVGFIGDNMDKSPVGKRFKIHGTDYICDEVSEGASLCGKKCREGESGAATIHDFETPTDGGINVVITKEHIIFAAYGKAQSSSHHEDVKSMMDEIAKVLRDCNL